MLGDGESWSDIQEQLGCSSAYIQRWKRRFQEQRLAGLFARHRGRRVAKRTPALEAKIPGLDPSAAHRWHHPPGVAAAWPRQSESIT